MKGTMPKPRLPYLLKERSRHPPHNIVWYVRKGDGPRTRIRGDYGNPDFMAAYHAAIAGLPAPDAIVRPAQGSLSFLVERYRESSAWRELSAATRRQRENIFRGVLDKAGAERYADVDRATITAGRESRSATPAQARNFLDAMRGLFRWALEEEKISVDPTAGVKNPAKPKGEGFPVWTEDDVDRYENTWPIGTKERVWLDVLIYTGLRRGDAVRLGPQHVSGGVATLKTEKSRFQVEVTIPILPVLRTTLIAGPCGDSAFICGKNGGALTKETFGNDFRDACNKAGVKKSAHGVRKIGATRAANAGATVSELEAIFGWSGGAMASLYTRAADRRRLATRAISKLQKHVP